MKVAVFLFVLYTVSGFNKDDAKHFLEQYGYITNNTLVDFSSSITNFQEQYNLHVDGDLNNETIALMQKPRCIIGEDDNAFTVKRKWNKTHLLWYFPLATNDQLRLAQKAFNMWANASTLTFEQIHKAIPKPDITIQMTPIRHHFRVDCMGQGKCLYDFDGPGKQLAHAFFPNDHCVEIHLDKEENWYYGDEKTPDGQYNFFMVLLHEMGHSLGVGHADQEKTVMFPWYQEDNFDLQDDDKNAIEYLCGKKNQYVPIPPYIKKMYTPPITTPTLRTTTTLRTISPQTKTTEFRQKLASSPREKKQNLCEIVPEVMFLAYDSTFPSYRLYIIKNKLSWKIDLATLRIPSAENLTDYLPGDIMSVSSIFQKSTGDLLVYSGNQLYEVSFPGLEISQVLETGIPKHAKINSAFQNDAGKIYILFNEGYIEFEPDISKIVNRGMIKDLFPKVPVNPDFVYKHTDGKLYWIHDGMYYKYSEFTRRVLEMGPFNWNIFGVPCPSKTLLDELKDLLFKVINIFQ